MQKADTEYLAREIAALRIALGEVATRDFLRSELARLAEELDEAAQRRQKLERRQQERQRAARSAASRLDEPRDDLDGDFARDGRAGELSRRATASGPTGRRHRFAHTAPLPAAGADDHAT